MSWMLKGLSQDMNLSEKDQVKYYLAFQKEDQTEIRLPVPEETARELIRLSHSDKIKTPPNPPQHTLADDPSTDPEDDSIPNGATEFGGESGELQEDDPPSDEEGTPESEDDVPSV